VDARHHVHAGGVAGRLERLAGHALEANAREVLVEVAPVHGVGALARLEDHARDRALALAGGVVARVGRQLEGRVGHGCRLGALLGGLALLGGGGVSLHVLAVLVVLAALRALLLEHEVRLEVGAGNDLVLAAGVLVLARACAGGGRFLGGGLAGRGLIRCGLVGCGLVGCGLVALLGGRRLAELLESLDLRARRLGVGRRLVGRRLVARRLLRRCLLGLRLALGRRALARLAGGALRSLVLGRLALGLLRLFGHQAFTSIGSGFCAAWGWSGPA
jgi:hypothetical protein